MLGAELGRFQFCVFRLVSHVPQAGADARVPIKDLHLVNFTPSVAAIAAMVIISLSYQDVHHNCMSPHIDPNGTGKGCGCCWSTRILPGSLERLAPQSIHHADVWPLDFRVHWKPLVGAIPSESYISNLPPNERPVSVGTVEMHPCSLMVLLYSFLFMIASDPPVACSISCFQKSVLFGKIVTQEACPHCMILRYCYIIF